MKNPKIFHKADWHSLLGAITFPEAEKIWQVGWMSKEHYFVGKRCKVFYNDIPGHVAAVTGEVIEYDAVSKEVILQEDNRSGHTAVTRIRIEVLA